MSQEKYCRYCGAPLTEGAKFCPNCGRPVGPTTSAYATAPTLPPRERREKEEKGEKQEKEEKGEKQEKGREGSVVGPVFGGLILIWLGLSFYLGTSYGIQNWWSVFMTGLGTILILWGTILSARRGHIPPYLGFLIGGTVVFLIGFSGVAESWGWWRGGWWWLFFIALGIIIIILAVTARRRVPPT